LVLIDLFLNAANISPKQSLNYILLRKIVCKKLKHKKSQRLTSFRQNNEVNFLVLKKICKNNHSHQTEGDNSPQWNFTLSDSIPPAKLESLDALYDCAIDVLKNFEEMSMEEIKTRICQDKDSPKRSKRQQHGTPKVRKEGSPLKTSQTSSKKKKGRAPKRGNSAVFEYFKVGESSSFETQDKRESSEAEYWETGKPKQ